MKKLLLPIVLLILGIGCGVGAGLALLPNPTEHQDALGPCGEMSEPATANALDEAHIEDASTSEFAKLNNQFVVPVVHDGTAQSLVVIALTVEVSAGQKETVFLAEPKLRDAFLQAMFDHANIGGFDGNFTSSVQMRPLREELSRRGRSLLPSVIKDVLVVEIVRQDS